MAPDLNTVPSSPRLISASASRRESQQMAPAPRPTSPSLNILPSNQNAVQQTMNGPGSPGQTVANTMSSSGPPDTGVGIGPGPLRHPRPLTAADLHLQLEKEQEAVVNRLTRELSLLRAAQNASVVSNSSSTSASFPDPTDTNANHLLSGASHPTPSYRAHHHRSSSSTSTRSATSGYTGASNVGVSGSITSGNAPAGTADRSRVGVNRHDSNPPYPQLPSRQNSVTSTRRSGASSPAGPLSHADYFPTGYAHRPPALHHRESSQSSTPHLDQERQPPITSVPATGRYEEAVFHRHELDMVRRENEELKRRIRELERTLREKSQRNSSRTRSESVSTTASVSGRARGWEEGVQEEGREEVRVGESARGGGLR